MMSGSCMCCALIHAADSGPVVGCKQPEDSNILMVSTAALDWQ